MKKNFGCKDYQYFIPQPVYDKEDYSDFYKKAWELAFGHIKDIPGMPQNPYMDEAFCETQLWIWDSCFMSLFTKYARDVFPGIETLNNFYGVLYDGKTLPKVNPPENEPWWTFAKEGEPYEIQVHIADNPPLFAWAEYENALFSGDKEYIKELLYEKKYLEKHYEWIESLKEPVKPKGVFLPTFIINEGIGYKWEGGHSGMDNTPRGRLSMHAEEERPNNPYMLWLDLICQQAFSAKIISKLFALLGDTEKENQWNTKYNEKKDIVNKFYWDEKDGIYYDIDVNTKEFYKVKTIASYWPMISGIASKEQAKRLVEKLFDPNIFGGFVPFVSLSRSDNDYQKNGEYWRGGVWLPTAYMTLKGLVKYGYIEEARELSKKLLNHMKKTYEEFEPHTLWEAYSPEECKPAYAERGGVYVRPDFCGWSALGPVSIYIEFILGFHKIDAFKKTVEWAKPDAEGKIGIKKLEFGDVKTDILADGNKVFVKSNEEYTLLINGKDFKINAGENEILL